MKFGDKLAALRTMSQAQTAKMMGISQAYLSNLENRDKAPRQEVLELLATFYDKPVEYFISDSDGQDESDLAIKYIQEVVEGGWPNPAQDYDGPDW